MTTVCSEQPGRVHSAAGNARVSRLWLLVAAGFAPSVWAQCENLLLNPRYQFFPIIWGCAAVLLYRSVQPLATPPVRRQRLASRGALYFGVLLLAVSIAAVSPWLAQIAAILTLLGWVLRYFKPERPMIAAWSLLWLTVPLPFGLDESLARALQSLTTDHASAVLDFYGFHHLRMGFTIELADRELFVSQACSGANSLFAILALIALLGAWHHRPFPVTLISMCAAPLWVGILNIARIVLIVVCLENLNVDLSEGWPHDALALALLPAALCLIAAFNRFLLILIGPISTPKWCSAVDLPLTVGWNRFWGWPHEQELGVTKAEEQTAVLPPAVSPTPPPLLVGCVTATVIGLVGLSVAPLDANADRAIPAIDFEYLQQLDAHTLPDQVDRWEQLEFESLERSPTDVLGHFSRTWTYGAGSDRFQVLVDFPFVGWHELSSCYRGAGWTIHDRQVIEHADGRYVRLQIERPGSQWALVCFSVDNSSGSTVDPHSHWTASWRDLDELLVQRAIRHRASQSQTHQFQLFAPRSAQANDEQVEDFEALFARLRVYFREQTGGAP